MLTIFRRLSGVCSPRFCDNILNWTMIVSFQIHILRVRSCVNVSVVEYADAGSPDDTQTVPLPQGRAPSYRCLGYTGHFSEPDFHWSPWPTALCVKPASPGKQIEYLLAPFACAVGLAVWRFTFQLMCYTSGHQTVVQVTLGASSRSYLSVLMMLHLFWIRRIVS
jgi:hypothetical protein